MEYSALVAVYTDLEATSGTHEKRRILAECLTAVEPDLLRPS